MKPLLVVLGLTATVALLSSFAASAAVEMVVIERAAQSTQSGGIGSTTRIDGITVGALLGIVGAAAVLMFAAAKTTLRLGAILQQWKDAIASTVHLPTMVQNVQASVERSLEASRANTEAIAELERWRVTVDVHMKRWIV